MTQKEKAAALKKKQEERNAKARAARAAKRGANRGTADKPDTQEAPKKRAEKIETRHMSELTKGDREALEELLRMDPSAITPSQKAHLSARSMYLTAEEREKFDL